MTVLARMALTIPPLPPFSPYKAYGVVHRSLDRLTNRIVALKQVRIFDSDRGNGIPITALREISILKSLRHTNIISVLDVAVSTKDLDDVYMVEEYAEQVGTPGGCVCLYVCVCVVKRIGTHHRWLSLPPVRC